MRKHHSSKALSKIKILIRRAAWPFDIVYQYLRAKHAHALRSEVDCQVNHRFIIRRATSLNATRHASLTDKRKHQADAENAVSPMTKGTSQ